MNHMSQMEELRRKIETERQKLDTILSHSTIEEAYNQSKLVDGLVEQYISLVK